jgi:hypothetical protein
MLILGRDEVADVQILEKSVSRRHALVQVENGTVRVTDLGSSSGTRINGARLTPDLPSSLDPGDFVQLGRVTMTYHTNPPPVKKAPAPPPEPAAKPVRRAAPAPPPDDRWKMIAIVFAFIAVAGLGAIIALVATRDDEPEPQPPVARVAEPKREPRPEPKPEPKPEPPKKETPPKLDEKLAPEGEMPPRGFLPPREFPDLIEFNYTEYYPVQLQTWDGSRIRAVGGDGRIYLIPQSKVTKSEDRVDLARRAARARAQLDPDDAEAHLELARWCARRYIRTETRALAKKVLELRPMDPEATQLLRSTE